ncbi:MAG: hypothetical protein QXG00_06120 [Candidatus Woesearchaeota archaeon]
MNDINNKVSIALSVDAIEDIIGYLKELIKFVAYENTIYNPFYSSVDVYVLTQKIEYLEDLIKNDDLKFIPEEQELHFEENNH